MFENITKTTRTAFLSYSHKDHKPVYALWIRLNKDGVDAWLDKENLLPGQDWQNEIRRAILKSDVVIVCLSQGFNKQQGFRYEELKIALEKARWLEKDVFIIPVRLEECEMPQSLRHLHRVDLFKRGGYQKLLLVLKND